MPHPQLAQRVAVLRNDLTGTQGDLANLNTRHLELRGNHTVLKAYVDTLPPVDEFGNLNMKGKGVRLGELIIEGSFDKRTVAGVKTFRGAWRAVAWQLKQLPWSSAAAPAAPPRLGRCPCVTCLTMRSCQGPWQLP